MLLVSITSSEVVNSARSAGTFMAASSQTARAVALSPAGPGSLIAFFEKGRAAQAAPSRGTDGAQ